MYECFLMRATFLVREQIFIAVLFNFEKFVENYGSTVLTLPKPFTN